MVFLPRLKDDDVSHYSYYFQSKTMIVRSSQIVGRQYFLYRPVHFRFRVKAEKQTAGLTLIVRNSKGGKK